MLARDNGAVYRPLIKKSRKGILLFLISASKADILRVLHPSPEQSTRMWISSFVVSLPAAEESAMAILRALAAIPVFTLGERQASRLPVVLEAPDGSTARYWHEWVEQLPGVIQVEVAFVSFDESEAGSGRLTSELTGATGDD